MNTQNSKCCARELVKPLLAVRQQHLANDEPMQIGHKTGRSKSIFPQKLWHLVNNSQLDSAIRWTLDGRSFLVFEHQFRNLCLGKENKFFYTTQPKSFVRQLHLYGFRKVNKNQFLHPNFKRDHPELLSNIRRTYKQSCLLSNGSLKMDPDEDNSETVLQHQQSNKDWSNHCGSQTLINSKTVDTLKMNVSMEHRYSSRRSDQSQSNFRNSLTELVATNQGNSHGSTNTDALHTLNSSSSPSIGAVVFPTNNYADDDEPYAPNPLAWYDANYADINYNYSEGLTLYNNDVYPSNSCEDNNNITL